MSVGDRTRLAEQARQRIEAQAHGLHDLELRTITVPESGNEGTGCSPPSTARWRTSRAPGWPASSR